MQLDIGKTRITLSFSFVAVVTLMLLLCKEEIVLMSLFSSLFHEGGHLFFMLLFSDFPEKIVFGAFGIRIERRSKEDLSYKKEAVVALGGIISNIILAFLSFMFYYFSKSSVCFGFFGVNLFIAAFNLIPVRQLDAGRFAECIVRSIADDSASEKIIQCITFITVSLIFTVCLFYTTYFGFNISLIAVTVYLITISIFKEFSNGK